MQIRLAGFPGSFLQPFTKTSEIDLSYNCIAWAAMSSDDWYEPDDSYNYFWPADVPRENTIEAYIQLFEYYGFDRCENGDNEEGFYKVAIFAVNGSSQASHAARQIQPGLWTSKLGQGIDVTHTIAAMSGGLYGDVIQYLKKEI